MSKHARIRRLRAEREAAKEEGIEPERGPLEPREAARRARVRKAAGVGAGMWAHGSRVRRQIKHTSSFVTKAKKKTRTKKRGRR